MDNTDNLVDIQKTKRTIPVALKFISDLNKKMYEKFKSGLIIVALFFMTAVLILLINVIESNVSIGLKQVTQTEKTRMITAFSEAEPMRMTADDDLSYNSVFDNYKGMCNVTINIFEEDSITIDVPMLTISEMISEYVSPAYNGDSYEFNLPNDTVVSDGMEIMVNKVHWEEYEFPAEIEFQVEYVDVQTIPKDTVVTVQTGENAQVTRVSRQKFINNEYDSENIIKETVNVPAVNQVIYRGIGGVLESNGREYPYSYYIDVTSTAYGVDTGYGGDSKYTYTGKEVKVGMIAVDPEVIPLGSKVYITSDEYRDLGMCYAEDVGNGIKGNHIDVYLGSDNLDEQLSFGIRNMRVYILE